MVSVGGQPFLAWLLVGLERQGVQEITLATGFGGDDIRRYFGDGAWIGTRIQYCKEPAPLGTGGAVRAAIETIDADRVLVVNGDSVCDFNFDELLGYHLGRDAVGTIVLARAQSSERYGVVDVDQGGAVLAFREKVATDQPSLVSAGIYLLERSLIELIPQGREMSIEREVFPEWVGRGLFGYVCQGDLFDLGTPSGLESMRAHYSTSGFARDYASTGMLTPADVLKRMAESSSTLKRTVEREYVSILNAARLIARAFADGGKLLLAGNGGSAADCQHIAAEFVSRLSKDRDRRALPAVALTTDSSFITAFANDLGYEGVFARQVEALAKPGDCVLVISTSGNSPNLLRCITAARASGATTIAITGEGGALASSVDSSIVVAGTHTQYVQEAMLPIEHLLCELVEDQLFPGILPRTRPEVGRAD